MSTSGTAVRSYLYVPGNAPSRMDKARASAADAVIVDLEDAVPWTQKAAARVTTRRWLDQQVPSRQELWVRVSPGAAREFDLQALAGVSGVTGIVLAKAESVEDVRSTHADLQRLGLRDLTISPLLETAAALLDCRAIAQTAGVAHLQIGEYDLCADTGISPDESETELAQLRAMVVLASAAANIASPPAPVSTEIRDSERFAASTQRAARQGFFGRACIHPAQLPVVHAIFTPSGEEIHAAKSVLGDLERAVAAGVGVLIDENGRLLDEAVVRRARHVVAAADTT